VHVIPSDLLSVLDYHTLDMLDDQRMGARMPSAARMRNRESTIHIGQEDTPRGSFIVMEDVLDRKPQIMQQMRDLLKVLRLGNC